MSRQGHGQPNPTWLPVGHEVVRRLARAVGGPGRDVGRDIRHADDRSFPRGLRDRRFR